MNTEDKQDKQLHALFQQLPNAELPPKFSENLMKKINKEAQRKERRLMIWGWSIMCSILAISLFLIKLVCDHLEIHIYLLPDQEQVQQYLPLIMISIGIIPLLIVDYKLRKRFLKH